MDAYASVISNNVNTVMKLLTVITIIITIPTLIASLWGMDVDVPFADLPGGFWIVIGIIVAITGIAAFFLIRASNSIRIKTPKQIKKRRRGE
jgi:magnesium transporter